VSLPEEDVEFLDAYAREHGYSSRSAALQHAISVLRTGQLAGAYEDAWQTWADSEDARLWDSVSADGARDSKAQAEQVRSVSVQRVGRRCGALTVEHVRALDQALRLHLGL